jgi:CHASE2 domain-containing sensor protein/nitrogen-specific signal transduction histidine kinase
VGGVAAALVVVLISTDWLWRVDRLLYDFNLRLWTRAAPSDVVIVAIDEESLSLLGRWPWSRRLHAAVIRRLDALGAKSIGLDILFAEPDANDPGADTVLAAAIAGAGKVVLPVVLERSRHRGQLVEALPIPILSQSAAGLGHVHVELDGDGIARSVYLRAGIGEAFWPTFAESILSTGDPERAGELMSERPTAPADAASPYVWIRSQHAHVPFVGPPGSFQRVAYVDVIEGRVSRAEIAGKHVLVGMTATGLGDILPTPVSGLTQPMPGVEFNANVLAAIRRGVTIEILSPAVKMALSMLLALLPVLLFPRLSPRLNLLTIVATMVATMVLAAVMLRVTNLWFAPSVALVCIVLGYPLWSWRKLESTVRYLNRELLSLESASAELPQFERPALETIGDFLSGIGIVDAWGIDRGNRAPSDATTHGLQSTRDARLLIASLRRDGTSWTANEALSMAAIATTSGDLVVSFTEPSTLEERRAICENLARDLTIVDHEQPVDSIELFESRMEDIEQLRSRLHRTEQIVQRSLDDMPEAILVTSGLGQVVLANRLAEHMFSAPPGAPDAGSTNAGSGVVGQPIFTLLEKLSPNEPGLEWVERVRTGLRMRPSIQVTAVGPAKQDLLIGISRFAPEEASAPALIVTLSDITSVRDHERRRAELISFLSHDLRSPLVSIIALTDLASNDDPRSPSGSEPKALFERTRGYAERSLTMVEQFLQLMRAESTDLSAAKPADFVAIALNAFDQVWSQAAVKNVQLEQAGDLDEAWILGEAELLERALVNLLGNAVKFTGSGGSVRMRLSTEDGMVACAIEDTGPGIDPERLDRLFERYVTFDVQAGHTQSGERGIGLGLAFVRTVAERHGGKVDVQSTLGEGSVFKLSIPRTRESRADSSIGELGHGDS